MKKILIISYSQSGQLNNIVNSILMPLRNHKNIDIIWEELKPIPPFPFPWKINRFLDVFPESVLMIPHKLKPFKFDISTDYDLIILAYTVWYLSPSIPISSFLISPHASVMKNKPVITVIGCRDMWIMAQEKVKKSLIRIGANHIDNAAFIDQGKRYATFITTPRWLLTGKKEAFLKIFPQAGVCEDDIENAKRFGYAILEGFKSGDIANKESLFKGLGAVKVFPNNIRFEKAASKNFWVWAKIISVMGKNKILRHFFLFLFILYLMSLILISIPFNFLFTLVVNPLRKKSIKSEIKYFEKPSGSSAYKFKGK